MINDSLVEKIRKLLALGSDLNDSPEQAELAMQKAKQLAIENDIDLASIQVFENKKSDEPIVKGEDINLGKRESVCQKFIYWVLQNHFNVKVITGGGRYYGRRLTLIGKTKDIQIATYINTYLNQEFMSLWHKYRRSNPYGVQTKDRNSYFWGIYNGLDSKLKEQSKTTESASFSSIVAARGSQAAAQVQNCYALAVVSNKERLEDAMNDFYPRLRSRSRSYSNGHHSESARSAGETAGRNISLRMGIGGGNGGRLAN